MMITPNLSIMRGFLIWMIFFLEVHYEGTSEQDESIQRVLAERGKTVYATAVRAGAILVDNGNLKLLGDVKALGR